MNPVDILLAEENFEDKVNDFEQNFTQFDISEEAPNDSLWWEVCLKNFAYTVTLLVALTGNLLVITTLIVDRSMRTVMNFYVANLAAADLVFSAGFMWIPLSNSITRLSFSLGALLCKLESFAQSKNPILSANLKEPFSLTETSNLPPLIFPSKKLKHPPPSFQI
ncbi:g_PROTEIN_RECEP_F1_2 domain-containing protein [Nephila pilipes]|uniref:G_PROTEIN_RECEP_F1_2 domain-containing protein n=1 Tax=Nephila pilipes TaxID=299642 RepID=A0A8X6P1M2_NEPPI|nr:g_PROTEIN_RECEP_F1_2 domain-containing protein [Nephila pilipes]